jgi:ankyrin repeat protein
MSGAYKTRPDSLLLSDSALLQLQVNAQDAAGTSALDVAVVSHNLPLARYLVTGAKADLTTRNAAGWTPLMQAAAATDAAAATASTTDTATASATAASAAAKSSAVQKAEAESEEGSDVLKMVRLLVSHL